MDKTREQLVADILSGGDESSFNLRDGDTLSPERRSQDGIRVSGVDTPELGLAGAREATATTAGFTNADEIYTGEKDNYGRRLSDFQDASGRLLSHELLNREQGSATVFSDDAQLARAREVGLRGTFIGDTYRTPEQTLWRDERRVRDDQFLQQLDVAEPVFSPNEGRGFHERAFDRGLDQVQQMGFGLTKLIGEALGSNSIADWAKKGIDTQALETFLNPRTTKSFTEAEGFSETLSSLYESLIEQVPNIGTTLAVSIASGGIGGLVGRQAAARIAAGETAATGATQEVFKQAVRRGMAVGAGATSVGMNTGETKLTFDREGIDNNGLAAFVGTVKGALDFAGLASIPGVNRLIGMGVRQSGKGVTRAQLFKEVPFKVMKAATIEGSTEALQQVADIVAVNQQKNRAWSDADTDSVIEALAVGAFVGKAFGTVGASAQAAMTPIQQEKAEAQAEALGVPTEQTNQEASQDIEAQQAEVEKGRKKGQFTADPNIEPGYSYQGQIAKVNDGKEAGVAKFRTRKEAEQYVDIARTEGVQEANRQMVLVDGAPKKSDTDPKTAEAVTAKVDGKIVDEAVVTPETKQTVKKNLKKQYPEAKIEVSTPEKTLKERKTRLEQEGVKAKREKEAKKAVQKTDAKRKAIEKEKYDKKKQAAKRKAEKEQKRTPFDLIERQKDLKPKEMTRLQISNELDAIATALKGFETKNLKSPKKIASALKGKERYIAQEKSKLKDADSKLKKVIEGRISKAEEVIDNLRLQARVARGKRAGERRTLLKRRIDLRHHLRLKSGRPIVDPPPSSEGRRERVTFDESIDATKTTSKNKPEQASLDKAKKEKTNAKKASVSEQAALEQEQRNQVKEASKPVNPVLTEEQAQAIDFTNTSEGKVLEEEQDQAAAETAEKFVLDSGLAEEVSKQQKKDEVKEADIVGRSQRDSTQRSLDRRATKIIRKSRIGKVIAGKLTRLRSIKVVKDVQKAFSDVVKGYGEGNAVLMQPDDIFKVFDVLPARLRDAYKELFGGIRVSAVFANIRDGKNDSEFNPQDGGTITINYDEMANSGYGGVTVLHELLHGVSLFHTRLADVAVKLKMTPAEVLIKHKKGELPKPDGATKEALDSLMSDPQAAKNSAVLAGELLEQYNAFMSYVKNMSPAEIQDRFGSEPTAMQQFEYAQTDVTEFAAVALTNPWVSQLANDITYGKQRRSVLQRIFDAFAKYFGIRDKSLLAALYTTVIDASTIDPKRQTALSNMKPAFQQSFTPRAQQPYNRITKGIKELFGNKRVQDLTGRTKSLFMGAATPFRSSLARLKEVSPALANRYKSRRGDARRVPGYVDRYSADESQWKADFAENIVDKDEAVMEKVYQDFIEGKRNTDGTKRMADFFKRFAKYLSSSSVPHIAALGKRALDGNLPYFPQIHDRAVIRENPRDYMKFLLKGNNGKAFNYTTQEGNQVPITESVAASITESMLKESELEGSLRPEAGSMHKRIINDPAYQAAALKAGWLNKDPRAVVEMYIKTMTRQRAFEETFGGWVKFPKTQLVNQLKILGYDEASNKNQNSLVEFTQKAIDAGQIKWPGKANDVTGSFQVWAPAKMREIALANIERRKGRNARQEAQKAMNAMDGIIGLELNDNVRNTMQWMTVAQSYMLLTFSTITSLPEFGVMMAGLVGKSPSAAWKGLKKFASDVGSTASQINEGKSFSQIKNESLAMARVLGTIPDALTATGFVDSSLFEAKGNMPRIAMEKLFTYNGNILFNNALRAIATNVGVDYFMEKSNAAIKGDKQAKADLKRWGVNPKEFTQWVADGRPAYQKNGDTNPISMSLLNFVDAHVARPTSDTKAVFGNDPRFMLIAQLKSFFYAYARDILPEIGRTFAQRYSNSRAADKPATLAALNSLLPAAVLGAVAIPLGMLADEIKKEIKALSDDEYEDRLARYRATLSNTEKAVDAVRSSGILGPIDLLLSFHDAQERDGSGLARALGPTASHFDTLWKYGPTSPEFWKRTIPLAGTITPGIYQDWIEEAKAERREEARNNG